jgi:Tol biopolymer transport system component
MRQITLLLFLATFILLGCKKEKTPDNGCIFPAITFLPPYSDPVWHPNGQLLGFNYTPLAGIGSNGVAPCIWYSYYAKQDSSGFYIMNKDGTGRKRITNFNLFAPAWTPDGNWIAFSLGSQIYKMRFTGTGFDTANIVQLTNNGGNFHPSWTADSDTIYFDSNVDAPVGTAFYSIWKMSSDGGGKTRITQSAGIGDTRQPSVAASNLIYFTKGALGQPEIFSMNKDGSNQIQVTFNGQNGNRQTPKFWQGNLFYTDGATLRVVNINGADSKLITPCITYDISVNGEIVYGKFDYGALINGLGILWIMNSDGTNNRQLTFNNF